MIGARRIAFAAALAGPSALAHADEDELLASPPVVAPGWMRACGDLLARAARGSWKQARVRWQPDGLFVGVHLEEPNGGMLEAHADLKSPGGSVDADWTRLDNDAGDRPGYLATRRVPGRMVVLSIKKVPVERAGGFADAFRLSLEQCLGLPDAPAPEQGNHK